MDNEVDPRVFSVIDRIRANSPKTGITEVIEKLGVRDARYSDVKFEYAWRQPSGGFIVTIWSEDVRVDPKTGNWFYVDPLDTKHRRGGGVRTAEQQMRAENRVDILRDAFQDRKSGFTGLLQINKIPIAQLEQNRKAEIGVRVKDDERWYVASWDNQRGRVILVRGTASWVPNANDIDGAPQTGAAPPAAEPAPPDPADQVAVVFPDQVHREEVERASVAYVRKDYEGRGYTVNDKSPDNLGYDLEVVDKSGKPVEHVEVKGRSLPTQAFFLTRNEWRRAHALYRLGIWQS